MLDSERAEMRFRREEECFAICRAFIVEAARLNVAAWFLQITEDIKDESGIPADIGEPEFIAGVTVLIGSLADYVPGPGCFANLINLAQPFLAGFPALIIFKEMRMPVLLKYAVLNKSV